MNENLKAFLDKLMGDAALAEKLGACKSEDEAYALAGANPGFTKEEFVKAMDDINKANNGGELSADDLASVAGGDDTTTTTTVTTATPTIGASSAAAAAI